MHLDAPAHLHPAVRDCLVLPRWRRPRVKVRELVEREHGLGLGHFCNVENTRQRCGGKGGRGTLVGRTGWPNQKGSVSTKAQSS